MLVNSTTQMHVNKEKHWKAYLKAAKRIKCIAYMNKDKSYILNTRVHAHTPLRKVLGIYGKLKIWHVFHVLTGNCLNFETHASSILVAGVFQISLVCVTFHLPITISTLALHVRLK